MQGWVKLYRSLLGDPVWQLSTPNQKSVLITILLLASHKKKEWEWNGEKYQIEPGQFITSAESLAQKSGKGITRQVVRGSLDRFRRMNFITMQTTKVSTLITVVNWGKFQDESEKTTNHSTNRQPTDNQPTTTIKNVKNDKNEKKSNIYSSSSDEPASLENDFEVIWKDYPNKTGKKQAFNHYKSWRKKSKENTNDYLMNKLAMYKKHLALNSWKKPMNGSTWFNGRFDDELDMTVQTQSKRVVQRETLPDWALDTNDSTNKTSEKSTASFEKINDMLEKLNKRKSNG